MQVTCRFCKRKWVCSKTRGKDCHIAKFICEVCKFCMAKNSKHSLEKIINDNKNCYAFNPSERHRVE